MKQNMVHDWILDVLTDLQAYASKNGLGTTEEHIGRALAVAVDELDARSGIAQGTAPIGYVREFSGTVGAGRNT